LPDFAAAYRAMIPVVVADSERYVDGLRKAGVPEE
jgi:hypothetical protein